MKGKIKNLFDSIASPILRSFVWRTYNTFKIIIFPAFAYAIHLEIQETGGLEFVNDLAFWANIGITILLSLAGGGALGLEKAVRVATEPSPWEKQMQEALSESE